MDGNLAAFQAIHKADNLMSQMNRYQKRIKQATDTFEIKTLDYTGWFVLLKRAPIDCGFEFVGIFNPDQSSEGEEPEWDYALPIPTPDSIPEFMGW